MKNFCFYKSDCCKIFRIYNIIIFNIITKEAFLQALVQFNLQTSKISNKPKALKNNIMLRVSEIALIEVLK